MDSKLVVKIQRMKSPIDSNFFFFATMFSKSDVLYNALGSKKQKQSNFCAKMA